MFYTSFSKLNVGCFIDADLVIVRITVSRFS